MRKSVLLFALFSAMMLASCNSSSKEVKATDESVDSTAVVVDSTDVVLDSDSTVVVVEE